MLGTAGAVVLRIFATVLVVWLLKIPWLLLAGGILLILIAYKLLTDENNSTNIKAGQSLGAAVGTIILADAAMGLDNVIAIAESLSTISLVVIGLLISVPIVVWGSTLFIKLINKYPWIIYIGSAVLGFTASSMITDEQQLSPFFEQHPLLRALFIFVIIVGILIGGHWRRQSSHNNSKKLPQP